MKGISLIALNSLSYNAFSYENKDLRKNLNSLNLYLLSLKRNLFRLTWRENADSYSRVFSCTIPRNNQSSNFM